MRIKYTDSEVEYTSFHYDADTGRFILSDCNGNEIEYSPMLGLQQEYEPSHFEYHLFANNSPFCTENSIYQVYVNTVRIGWIFPIQALFSLEHDYANNIYFLRYAYVATYHLLDSINCEDQTETPDEFSLMDYYDPSKCIFVLDKDNCSLIENFNLNDYTVSLFKYGYSKKGKGNIDAELSDMDGRKNLHLNPISKDLKNTSYINALFEEQFSTQENEITRFYFIYQVIELLIFMVFEHQLSSIISVLKETPEKLFEVRDSLADITKEKHRIGKLFSCYANKVASRYLTDLNTACIQFLSQNQLEEKNECWENLYSVRCFLVHKLYSLQPHSLVNLHSINQCFLSLIIEILIVFSIPPN